MSPLLLHPPPKTPPTNHQHKQLQEKTLTTVQVVCGHFIKPLLAPPSVPAPNPPTPVFYDWLFEPGPNETVHVPQSEQSGATQNPQTGGLQPNLLQITCAAAEHMELKGLYKPVVGIFNPCHLLLNSL